MLQSVLFIEGTKSLIVTRPLPALTINKNASFNPAKKRFEDLCGEVRNHIYRMVLTEGTIDFTHTGHFARSSAFLRVNNFIYGEARQILYGGNLLVFGRETTKVGAYWEYASHWIELGHRHIREFVSEIGQVNTSYIRKVRLGFEDGSKFGYAGKSLDEHLLEINRDIVWISKHLGEHGKIVNLKLGLCGRRLQLSSSTATFLKALKGVNTDVLRFAGLYIDSLDFNELAPFL